MNNRNMNNMGHETWIMKIHDQWPCWSLIRVSWPLYPRFCPESRTLEYLWPLYTRISRNTRGIFMGELRALFTLFPGSRENVQKVHRGRRWNSRTTAFVSEVLPGKSSKTSDTKDFLEEFLGILRIPRESVRFDLVVLPFLEIREFRGIPGGSKRPDWLYSATFSLFHKVKSAKSARGTGILGFQGKLKSICNGFGLTALLFQFSQKWKLIQLLWKSWKTWGLSGIGVVQYRVCDRTELMIVEPPFSRNFSITLRLNWGC